MGKLILQRLVSAVPVLLIVSVVVFMLTFMVPGDPAFSIAGESATPEQIEETRMRLGLNDPIYIQYWSWFSGAITGDLGTSLFSSQSVTDVVLQRFPVTLSLTLGALLFAVVVGIPAGILAAVRRGKLTDRVLTIGTSGGLAMPNYFLGLLLVLLFALTWPLFPATGYVEFGEDPAEWARHLVLPTVTLGTTGAAIVTRQLRSSMAGVLTADYIRMARSKGMRGRVVVVKHALKNAMVPVVTVIGTQVAILLGGTVLIEQIFGLPGLGSLVYGAVVSRDVPMIQGVVLFTTVMVLLVNMFVDISYGWLNPRVRSS